MPHRKAKKVRVLKIKKVAPDIHHVELEVIGGAPPPAAEPPVEALDMTIPEAPDTSSHVALPEPHKSWWFWLTHLW